MDINLQISLKMNQINIETSYDIKAPIKNIQK